MRCLLPVRKRPLAIQKKTTTSLTRPPKYFTSKKLSRRSPTASEGRESQTPLLHLHGSFELLLYVQCSTSLHVQPHVVGANPPGTPYRTLRSTLHPGFTNETASPSLGDAATELKGCRPSRTIDARNLSVSRLGSPVGASSRPFPGLSCAAARASASAPLAPMLVDDASVSNVWNFFHKFRAPGHKADSATSDSTRAIAAADGLMSWGSADEASHGSGETTFTSPSCRDVEISGAVGSTMSRLVACATSAKKAFCRPGRGKKAEGRRRHTKTTCPVRVVQQTAKRGHKRDGESDAQPRVSHEHQTSPKCL